MRNLGLPEPQIEQVQADHHVEGLQQVVHAGITAWSRARGAVTVADLARALHRTGHNEALDQLRP